MKLTNVNVPQLVQRVRINRLGEPSENELRNEEHLLSLVRAFFFSLFIPLSSVCLYAPSRVESRAQRARKASGA